jgi:predicted ATPase/DNA-binding CsgD family transcriptional regulator
VIRNAFIGRESQLREVVRRLSLPDGRLVTIVGRSGVGKTRLALEVARRLVASYQGGIALIDCSVPDGRPTLDRVAAALGVRVAPGQSPWDAVQRRLRTAPVLLLADDVDAVDDMLDELLDLVADSPSVRILATAQRPTGHGEEHPVRLRPLPAPAPDADAQSVRAAPAVALYVARATASNPAFAPSDADLAAIGALCRRLDGLPLAIELGAARARLLSPARQLDALDGGDLLALRAPRGDRRPERHQDLRSAIETTWSMTEPAEQAVLRRMAVFLTPPTLARLHAVVSEPGWTTDDLLDALGGLVDLGLVEPEGETDAEARYRLLPTIRALGLERLETAGEEQATFGAHEHAYLQHARDTRTLPEAFRARLLAAEAADLAAVLDRLEANRSTAAALELASDLAGVWARIGISPSVRTQYGRILAAAEAAGPQVPPAILARGLVGATILAIEGRTLDQAREQVGPWLQRATALAREARDDHALLGALEWSAVALIVTGDMAWSMAANSEGRDLAERLGLEVALTRFEYRASMLAGMAGDIAGAVAAGTSAYRRATICGDPESIVRSAVHLASFPPETPGLPADLPSLETCREVAHANALLFEEGTINALIAFDRLLGGNVASAASACVDGFAFAARFGAWQAATFTTVALLLIAGAVEDVRLVARLHGVLLPVLAEAITGQTPVARPMFVETVAAARAALGDEAFAAEEATTSRLDREAAVDWAVGEARRLAGEAPAPRAASAIHDAPRSSGPDGPAERARLTAREREVLAGIASGRTNREIGASLGLTEKTVMHHTVSIYAKLGVRGRAEAAAWAMRNLPAGDTGDTGDTGETAERG